MDYKAKLEELCKAVIRSDELADTPMYSMRNCIKTDAAAARRILAEIDPQPLPYKGREAVVEKSTARVGYIVQVIDDTHCTLLYAYGDTREQAIARYNACVKGIEEAGL